MSLTMGCHLNCNHWTSLPMPQDVIDHIHALAHHQGATAGLTFTNCHSVPQDPYDLNSDDDNDSSYSPSDNDSNEASAHSNDDADPNLAANTDNIAGVAEYDEEVEELNDNADGVAEYDEEVEELNDNADGYIEVAGVNDNANNNAKIAGVDKNQYPPDDNYYPQAFHDKAANDDEVFEVEDEAIDRDHPNEDDVPIIEMVEDEKDPCNDLEHAMDEQYGTCTGTYNLHPRCAHDYSHLHATFASSACNADCTFAETVMTQHTMKKGLEVFREAGVQTILTEMKQHHDCDVMEPKFADELFHEDRCAALWYLMFLEKKHCGRVKG